jgi:diacylglycerol O-acyltransferase
MEQDVSPGRAGRAGMRGRAGRVDRLTAEDRLILWPDALWPQEVAALLLLDAPAGGSFAADVRALLASRVDRVPRLRQVLVTPPAGLGPPLWADDPAFEVRRHVREVPVAAPGDERALLAAVEGVRRRRLDRDRPLWEVCLFTGLPGGRVAALIRVHHVIADGIAAIATIGEFLDEHPGTPPAPPLPWSPAPAPASRDLRADRRRRAVAATRRALGTAAHPVAAARRWAGRARALGRVFRAPPVPVTGLDRTVGPDRTLALVRARLDGVVAAGHRYGATVNDVLLAATAAGLRALPAARGDHPDERPLPVYVPVTLRRPETRGSARGNLIAQMVVPVPVAEPDPVARLRAVAAATREHKTRAHPSLGTLFRSPLARLALLRLLARRPVSVTTADLPGPPRPVHLAGVRVREVFALLPLVGNITVGVGAISYAGAFTIMVTADAATCPDLAPFAAAVEADLAALAGAGVR